jgi:hypothetical protein
VCGFDGKVLAATLDAVAAFLDLFLGNQKALFGDHRGYEASQPVMYQAQALDPTRVGDTSHSGVDDVEQRAKSGGRDLHCAASTGWRRRPNRPWSPPPGWSWKQSGNASSMRIHLQLGRPIG